MLSPTAARDHGTDAGWHAEPVAAVIRRLHTDAARGVSTAEARLRLAADGPNVIAGQRAPSALAILARQFQSVVVWVLVLAAVVAGMLGDALDAIAIVAIVVLNAAIGFLQEHRAERALAALARITAPRARVVREARSVVVPAAEVVRGDVLLLDGGDVIAADARLLESSVLRVVEAALTGESEAVNKAVTSVATDTPLADRRGMVHLGTNVVAGTGRAVVVATGMDTEVGRIATLLAGTRKPQTPLQQRLDRAGHRLLIACLGIVVVVAGLGTLRATPPLELLLTALSLAVAAIPEGLPAVVTVTLALGVQRMARRRALVRRLASVETLGCAEVVCTDKTGTLTVGEMTARRVVTAEHVFTVTGEGYAPEGDVFAEVDDGQGAASGAPLRDLLRTAVACNDAELDERDGRHAAVGDPTEAALLVLAGKAGVRRDALESALPRCGSVPFDSDRKRMTVLRRCGGRTVAFVKGAPETVLERCTRVRLAAGDAPLTEALRARMGEAIALLAADALRVIALAERDLDAAPDTGDPEHDLVLLGLVGMQDPPRAEALDAVRRCHRAGVRTVMITGDHPDTARAIARELEILRPQDEVMVGAELDQLDDEALAARVRAVSVYARVTAEHKLRIVRAWQAAGTVVAMTGDGVNDAPALREAAIGIAMGRAGTEVTKEAADLVVADDNFASIVAAIEEGRGVYDNIVKTLHYLLAGNVGELAVMLVAGMVGWPLPLLPIHLLWINLVTDGLPALGLATEPVDPDVLSRPPRRASAELVDRAFVSGVGIVGGLIGAAALVAFAWEWETSGDLAAARYGAFAVLVVAQLLRALGARSDRRTVWQLGLASNLRLLAAVGLTLLLQAMIHVVPVLTDVFAAVRPGMGRLATWVGLGTLPFLALEAAKTWTRDPALLAVGSPEARICRAREPSRPHRGVPG